MRGGSALSPSYQEIFQLTQARTIRDTCDLFRLKGSLLRKVNLLKITIEENVQEMREKPSNNIQHWTYVINEGREISVLKLTTP